MNSQHLRLKLHFEKLDKYGPWFQGLGKMNEMLLHFYFVCKNFLMIFLLLLLVVVFSFLLTFHSNCNPDNIIWMKKYSKTDKYKKKKNTSILTSGL